MEINSDSRLQTEVNRVNQHNIILLRRIKDLEKSQNMLQEEKNTAENKHKEEVQVLKEQLNSSESRNLILDEKVQSVTKELTGLRDENNGFVKKIEELEMQNRKNQVKVRRLKEKCGEIKPTSFPKSDGFKIPKIQQYRYEALKKTLASDRNRFAEKLRKTEERANYYTGLATRLQEKMRKWHIDDFNAESQRRKHTIQHLTDRVAQLEEKVKKQGNMIYNLQNKVRTLTLEKENLQKHLDAVTATQPKKQKLDKLINNLRNEKEEALSSKKDKNPKAQGKSISIGNGVNNDNPNCNEEPPLKRSRLGDYAVHHLPLKKQWAFTK